jgi:hypothetical protein
MSHAHCLPEGTLRPWFTRRKSGIPSLVGKTSLPLTYAGAHNRKWLLPLRVPAGSSQQICWVLLPMSMSSKQPHSFDISIHVLKYAFATLIQGVTPTLRHQLFEHSSYRLYCIHQLIQFRKLSLGKHSPTFRRANDVAKTKEQMLDFTQCETQFARTLNDC